MTVNANNPKCPQQPDTHSIRVDHTPGIITITDANTTIGYCRYNESAEIEYVFVNAAHRRMGWAKWMLANIEQRLAAPCGFQPPISPLGKKLIESYNRCQQHQANFR